MEDCLKSALELAKAQASVRVMSEDEITSFVQKLAANLRSIQDGGSSCECATEEVSAEEVRKSVKEKSVTCLECGQTFKILTKRHLALHGLTPAEYREKYGMKKNTPLVCKTLQRERRKKMQDMQLWEKRKKYNK